MAYFAINESTRASARAGVLLAVAVAACVIPVRRALSVDVASALRAD